MPGKEFTFTYFQVHYRGEFVRAALACAEGVDFKDDRIEWDAWPAIKETLPLGTTPALWVDGKQFASELSAVMRYIGRIGNLYPSDPVKALRVDEMENKIMEIFVEFLKWYHCDSLPFPQPHDEATYKKEQKKFEEETFPAWAKAIQEYRKIFGTGKYLCGNDLTIADIYLWVVINFFESNIFNYAKPFKGFEENQFFYTSFNNTTKNPGLTKYYQNLELTEAEKPIWARFLKNYK